MYSAIVFLLSRTNIWQESDSETSLWRETWPVNYCCKTLHLRCLQGSWLRLGNAIDIRPNQNKQQVKQTSRLMHFVRNPSNFQIKLHSFIVVKKTIFFSFPYISSEQSIFINRLPLAVRSWEISCNRKTIHFYSFCL